LFIHDKLINMSNKKKKEKTAKLQEIIKKKDKEITLLQIILKEFRKLKEKKNKKTDDDKLAKLEEELDKLK
jgi:hypothetical protein